MKRKNTEADRKAIGSNVTRYMTAINKASGKPVAIKKQKPDVITVYADYRINTP